MAPSAALLACLLVGSYYGVHPAFGTSNSARQPQQIADLTLQLSESRQPSGCDIIVDVMAELSPASTGNESDTQVAAVILLLSGRAAGSCTRQQLLAPDSGGSRCNVPVARSAADRPLHLYALLSSVLSNASEVVLVSSGLLPGTSSPIAGCAASGPAAQEPAATVSLGPSVGLLYEGWHAPAVTALNNVSALNGSLLSVEDVIASNGSLSLFDMLDKYGQRSTAQAFFYQERPADGFYCIYRARPGEAGIVPDCTGINATLQRHATQLTSAGIQYVTVDATNLGTPSSLADLIQVRPGEVLLEEWAALRAAGVPTPAVAAWQRADTGSTLWQGWLDLYNNGSYSGLILRDPSGSGRKVLFVPENPDPAVVAAIESNGGRGDVVVQVMWAENHREAQGQWSFFAPCTVDAGGGAATYTTSVVGEGRGASGCGQVTSTGGPLGSQIAVSPSYQLGYGSVPFQAAGKYGGLTFKRQFGTLFEGVAASWRARASQSDGRVDAATAAALPDNVYVSSWNERTAQPQANPFPAPFSFSLGLPWDSEGASLWVDSFGASLSRDIEPSTDAGAGLLEVMASCLRVAQLAALLDAAAFPTPTTPDASNHSAAVQLRAALSERCPTAVDRAAALAPLFGSGGRRLSSCAVGGEVCCAYNETTDGYVPVWSLRLTSEADSLLTGDSAEVARLACPGCGWMQMCNGYGGPTDFCVDPAALQSTAAWHGPFVLHSGGCGALAAAAATFVGAAEAAAAQHVALPGRVALYRCYDGSRHFFDTSPSCGGATLESVLGCMAASRSSMMARGLRGCTHAGSGMRYHSLDGACDGADADAGILGFVR